MDTEQLIQGTCPECRGPLSVVKLGGVYEYRCLVGHTYSARTLLLAHSDAQEKALWSGVVALEEAMKIVEAVAPELRPEQAERLIAQAEVKQQQAREIRSILERLEPFQIE